MGDDASPEVSSDYNDDDSDDISFDKDDDISSEKFPRRVLMIF